MSTGTLEKPLPRVVATANATDSATAASAHGVPRVYAAIASVTKELAKSGISKDRRNQQQGYSFRGIDDVYNALAPLLAEHGLVILPRTLSRECIERTTQKGGVLFYVIVSMEFDFVSAADASKHTVAMIGEAMDSADKATNKAQSAAYKYACMQAFCIPTEGDNDSENQTHEVAPRSPRVELPPARAQAPPDGYGDWLIDMESTSETGSEALRVAWDRSKLEYRKYLTATASAKWEALKRKAASVQAPA